MLKRHRVDVHQLLDAASEALAKGDWAVVVRNARICLNVTRPNDFTQGDKRALAPHALEFVVHEFSDAIKSLAPPPAADALITMNFTKRGGEGVRGKIRDALLVDFDLDAKLDLLVLEESKLSVFRQLGPFRWEQLTTMEFEGDYFGLLAADLDRDRDHEVNKSASEATDNESISCFDADTDVVLYGKSGLLVLRNKVREDGTRSLEAVPQEESVAQIKEVNNAILLDFDHDSNLDIFCSTATGLSALLGQGEMAFVDASVYSTFPQLDASTPVNSLVAVDWDRDVDIDIVAIAKDHSFGYLENLRHGNFRWQPFDEAYAPLLGSSSLAVVEADANVSWDLVGTGQSGTSLLLTRTPQSGVVQFQATEEISNVPADRVVLADVDNNGHQDMITWTKDSVSIIRARSDGTFDNPIQLNEVPAEILRCDVGDVDDDGDLDLCVAGTSEAILFANDGGNANNWLSIRAMGQVDNAGKANHHGIGSLIEVKAGQLYQAQVVSRPVTHFGLGKEPNAAIVRFLWTNGVPQDKLEPAANQAMCELMTLKGSCPYVYTWTGERFEFFTDCLWAAPIGLQLAEDVLAPSRSWEYLRIPGDRLRERDGHYELQITEELWEAGYFDLVELIAVDHPTDVEVFSNEKVGPAEISAFKLHTVRERRYPVAATDQKGRDVLSQIRHGDGQFLRGFRQDHCARSRRRALPRTRPGAA